MKNPRFKYAVSMKRPLLVTACALALLAAPLAANIVVPTEFREIVADASVIVRGRITDVRAVVVPGAGIDSVATVAVESVMKGEAPDFVNVRVPGGEVGRTRFVVIGSPTFKAEQRAVFFLKRGADNGLRPVGLTMGIFRVQVDRQTGRALVEAPLVVGRTASTGPVVRGDARRRPLPVSEFEALVRVVAQGQTGGGAIPRGAR